MATIKLAQVVPLVKIVHEKSKQKCGYAVTKYKKQAVQSHLFGKTFTTSYKLSTFHLTA